MIAQWEILAPALFAGVENNGALQHLQAAQERVLQRLGLELASVIDDATAAVTG